MAIPNGVLINVGQLQYINEIPLIATQNAGESPTTMRDAVLWLVPYT